VWREKGKRRSLADQPKTEDVITEEKNTMGERKYISGKERGKGGGRPSYADGGGEVFS